MWATEVLIIDDEAPVREMLAVYLRQGGFATVTFGDGRAAIERCRQALPAAVLCDLRMPALSGLEVLAVMKREFPQLPVIVVSGTADVADAILALKLGAADYVTKPIEDFAVLDHALGNALERARLLAENQAYSERLERSLKQLKDDENHARRIQIAMLPPARARIGEYECSCSLATAAILGGDFVDYFTIDDRHFGFYIADVSGHGVASAVITVLLKSYVGRYLEDFRRHGEHTILDPAALLAALNRDFLAGRYGKYLTIFYGVVTQTLAQLVYANGGQYPLPLLCDGGGVREIGARSQPVGLFEEAHYANEYLAIDADFSLRLFSDGVLELLAPGDLRGRKEALRELAVDPAVDAVHLADMLGMNGGRTLPDDASILCVRRVQADG